MAKPWPGLSLKLKARARPEHESSGLVPALGKKRKKFFSHVKIFFPDAASYSFSSFCRKSVNHGNFCFRPSFFFSESVAVVVSVVVVAVVVVVVVVVVSVVVVVPHASYCCCHCLCCMQMLIL